MGFFHDSNSSGIIFTFSGPSGAGKTSIINFIMKLDKEFVLGVSHTTRKPLSGELEGRDYYFINKEQYFELFNRGEFIAYTQKYGYHFGLLKKDITAALRSKKDVILNIDLNGLKKVKQEFAESVVSIYISPPDFKSLEDRLRKRKRDNETNIRKRMDVSKNEMREVSQYDYLVVNKDFDRACNIVFSIIESERSKVIRHNLAEILSNLDKK